MSSDMTSLKVVKKGTSEYYFLNNGFHENNFQHSQGKLVVIKNEIITKEIESFKSLTSFDDHHNLPVPWSLLKTFFNDQENEFDFEISCCDNSNSKKITLLKRVESELNDFKIAGTIELSSATLSENLINFSRLVELRNLECIELKKAALVKSDTENEVEILKATLKTQLADFKKRENRHIKVFLKLLNSKKDRIHELEQKLGVGFSNIKKETRNSEQVEETDSKMSFESESSSSSENSAYSCETVPEKKTIRNFIIESDGEGSGTDFNESQDFVTINKG